MLTTPSAPASRRPGLRARWAGLVVLASAGLAPLAPMPLVAQTPAVERPAGLVVLDEQPRLEGVRLLGVYGPKPAPGSPGLWRVQLWRQAGADVQIQTDTVGCGVDEPMWVTEDRGRQLVRFLNPGGLITPANRVDHLVWWAVCHPQYAGRDPSGLQAVARELGYSTTLRESEQVLPGRSR